MICFQGQKVYTENHWSGRKCHAYMTKIRIFARIKRKINYFLLALGPTATVLAYDLCKMGYQAVDIGHRFGI